MIPSHLTEYYESDQLISDAVVTSFEKAASEIRWSGTCIAAGLYTACVFHAMRAAEIGLRSVDNVKPIKIKNGKPIEFAEWREILDGLSNLVRDIENLPNSTPGKDEDLLFYSEALAQFRFSRMDGVFVSRMPVRLIMSRKPKRRKIACVRFWRC